MRTLMKLLCAALAAGALSACAVKPVDNGAPKVDHIRLEVSNMDASIAFYRELGLEPGSISPNFSVMHAGNMDIVLSSSPWAWVTARAPGQPAGWGIYPHLLVADVPEAAARMKRAGYKIAQPPRVYERFTEAFVADPDGYTWALFSWNRRP